MNIMKKQILGSQFVLNQLMNPGPNKNEMINPKAV